ncbi:MAG: glutamate racemase, partial [Syntrophotalea acetylenica]|nr:glutamate racemase [Syntrophotalea acetylenica]
GLTVLKEIQRLLPGEDLLYLGDTARVPYGTKSPATVRRYAMEAAAFLTRRRVKMLVVACNTASSVALADLENQYKLPVIGVIEPGAKRAVSVTRSGRIGVIGTEGTIKSGAYTVAIKRLAPDADVVSIACPLFVPLVEEGWLNHPVTHLTARAYLDNLRHLGIDTLVLGCTHYPLLKPVLQEVLGPEVILIDSAEETAFTVAAMLGHCHRLRPSGEICTAQFFVTDVPERFQRVGSEFLGCPLATVEQVALD